jgi:hypothetical protein
MSDVFSTLSKLRQRGVMPRYEVVVASDLAGWAIIGEIQSFQRALAQSPRKP